MKYLILGSQGQIGIPLKDYLLKKNNNVTLWDIKRNYIEDLRQYSYFLEKQVKENDFVLFLAWDVGGSKYLSKYENTYEFINNNVLIMQNVFRSLKAFEKPFVFLSSQLSFLSNSTYGVLKLLGEKYAQSLNGLSVRLWNVYGREEEDDEKSHVITDFINMAISNNCIDMKTNGKEKRQFLFVEDCCEALYIICENYHKFKLEKNIIDLSNFEWTTVEDVARIVSKKINNCKINKTKTLNEYSSNIEPNNFILDYWKPKTSLEDGISIVIDWLKKENELQNRRKFKKFS